MATTTSNVEAAAPTIFTLRDTQLLSEGRSKKTVAVADALEVQVKVYASGGENALHTHLEEDHVFLVLAGKARYHLGVEDNAVEIGPYEGVFLPKGAYYRFESIGEENLVLYRVGTATRGDDRVDPSGKPLPGGSVENLHVPGVPIPGRFFASGAGSSADGQTGRA